MSNFQNQEINIGSVVLGDRSLSNVQYGDKKSIRHVNFDVPFSGIPKVSLGINFLDASSSEQIRIRCITQNITSKGMDILFTTWNDNTVYDVAVDYVAIYNPKFGNSNNNNNTNNISNTNTNQQTNQYNDNENNNYQQNQQINYENTNNNNNNNNNNESEDNYKQQQGRYQQENNNNNRNDNDNDNDYQSQSQSQSNNFNGKNVNIKSNKFNNYIRDNNGKGDMSQTARNNETWIITSANNNNNNVDLYYIHNRYNHYLSSNGDRVLIGEKNDSSIWKISQRRQGVYSIQNIKNSNYLSSTDRNELKTNVKVVNSWEEFNFNFVQ
ncbi:hypothetical protein ACTFIY_003800 [Dictyostelium cf. discoideum]